MPDPNQGSTCDRSAERGGVQSERGLSDGVSLIDEGGGNAFLVSPKHVLTAATCASWSLRASWRFSIRAGCWSTSAVWECLYESV